MNKDAQRAKAEAFRAMHDGKQVLVLVNAWDAGSARFIENAGARAIASSSAGVAFSLGYSDGEYVPLDEFVGAIARIARVIKVPLSADIEAGFGADEKGVGETVRAIIEAGAVGINLEDSTGERENPLYDIETAVARVRAARAAGEALGVPLVINARTDALVTLKGERGSILDEAIKRAKAYRAAGADSLFPLGLEGEGEIARATREINGPVNLLFRPNIPALARLKELGIARLSLGSAAALAALTLTHQVAQEMFSAGTYPSMLGRGINYVEANKIMEG
jgi:2-methylisocitrate lyase-like PEP mutase family enzyme